MGLFTVIALLTYVPYGIDLMQGNAPMMLYGRVIDQTGKPIANAPVDFTASADTGFPIGEPRRVERNVSTTTDRDGYFYLNGGRGVALYSLHAGELGSRKGSIPAAFSFGRRIDGRVFHPDPLHPVMFMWWNDAYKRIISKTVTYRPAWQRGCTLEYLSGAMTNTEGNLENLEILVQCPPAGTVAPFTWSVDVRALDGGLVQTDKALATEAPNEGYEATAHYTIAANSPHWSRHLAVKFYTRSHGYEIGSPIYAGVDLEVTLDANNADPTVTLKYIANFGNSRDLVPGPVKQPLK